MAAPRVALLHSIRSLAEAASLPQTRALLERARNGILGADTASQALPFLEVRRLLLVCLPLLGSLTAGLFGRQIGCRGAVVITVALLVLCFVTSYFAFYEVAPTHAQKCTDAFVTEQESQSLSAFIIDQDNMDLPAEGIKHEFFEGCSILRGKIKGKQSVLRYWCKTHIHLPGTFGFIVS